MQGNFKDVARRKASNGIVFLFNLTELGGNLITDSVMPGYFIIPTEYISERYGIAGDVWQCKTKDLLTLCTKNLQEITARCERLVSKHGNLLFCKDWNRCYSKFCGVLRKPIRWIMT